MPVYVLTLKAYIGGECIVHNVQAIDYARILACYSGVPVQC